jgi:hypothetical protein
VLAIVGDQDTEEHGTFLLFFGQADFSAAFFLPYWAGSPIITAFGVCRKDGSMKMKIEELCRTITCD